MAHRTSFSTKLYTQCSTSGTFLAIMNAKFPLNFCSRLRFFEPKHKRERSEHIKVAILISTAGALAVAVLSTRIPRASNLQCFPALSTVQNVVDALSINLYTLSILEGSFCNTMWYLYAVPSQRSA
jgi:hypothetical protein